MKLGKFFSKDPQSRSFVKKVITVSNEVKENELSSKVSILQAEIERFATVEKENSVLHIRVRNAETYTEETVEREQKLIQTNKLLQLSVTEGENIKSDNQRLTNELTEFTRQLDVRDAGLEQARQNNLQLTVRADTLTQQLKEVKAVNDDVRLKLDSSLLQTATSIESFNKMATKLDETHKMFLANEVKYKEEQRRNYELTRKVTYLTRVANTLEEERDELEQTRHILKELASNVEADNVETKGAVRITQSELRKLRGTVGTMTMNMDGLVRENKELSSFNSALKNEVARPKYMSMSAIARSEGFKLPTGGYRKHFLGNSKPTLLKFKREENHDN